MTLLETINLLNWMAVNQPNVNGIVTSGDIFDLNKDEYQQRYAAFCAQQDRHEVNQDFTTYRFNLYYVDRLVLDKSNAIEVQSTAVQFFQNLIKTVQEKLPNLEFTNGDVVTFTQRFSAECAGAYMSCSVTTPNTSMCAIIKQELGEFAPLEYSDDWFKWVEKYI